MELYLLESDEETILAGEGGGETDVELMRRLASRVDEATKTIGEINADLVYGLWIL